MSYLHRNVNLKTKLPGNFRLVVMEQRNDQYTGEKYFIDENGNRWQAPAHICISKSENLK